MKIIQSGTFKKVYKPLHKNQRHMVNKAIDLIIKKPNIGTPKTGDLKDYYVYKFDCVNQQFLLSYLFSDGIIELLALGHHENFYRNLKRSN